MESFSTERLVCRHADFGDENFLLELYSQPEFINMVYDKGFRTSEDLTQYIANKIKPEISEFGAGSYILTRKSDQKKIGLIGLFNRKGIDGVDIGFTLLSSYFKMGYMKEAGIELMKHAEKTFRFPKVSGVTLEQNNNSRKLLELLGLKLVQEDFYLPNQNDKLCLYEKVF